MSEIGLGKRVWLIQGKRKVCTAERMGGCCLARGVSGAWAHVAAKVGSGALEAAGCPEVTASVEFMFKNCSTLWLKALLFKHNVARFPFIWKLSNHVMYSGVQ